MLYKAGDKVKIVNHRVSYMNPQGKMDKYFGKIMTIKEIIMNCDYRMQEDYAESDDRGWLWNDDMIECKVNYSKEYR